MKCNCAVTVFEYMQTKLPIKPLGNQIMSLNHRDMMWLEMSVWGLRCQFGCTRRWKGFFTSLQCLQIFRTHELLYLCFFCRWILPAAEAEHDFAAVALVKASEIGTRRVSDAFLIYPWKGWKGNNYMKQTFGSKKRECQGILTLCFGNSSFKIEIRRLDTRVKDFEISADLPHAHTQLRLVFFVSIIEIALDFASPTWKLFQVLKVFSISVRWYLNSLVFPDTSKAGVYGRLARKKEGLRIEACQSLWNWNAASVRCFSDLPLKRMES